jgi:hypothetical protein
MFCGFEGYMFLLESLVSDVGSELASTEPVAVMVHHFEVLKPTLAIRSSDISVRHMFYV